MNTQLSLFSKDQLESMLVGESVTVPGWGKILRPMSSLDMERPSDAIRVELNIVDNPGKLNTVFYTTAYRFSRLTDMIYLGFAEVAYIPTMLRKIDIEAPTKEYNRLQEQLMKTQEMVLQKDVLQGLGFHHPDRIIHLYLPEIGNITLKEIV